MKIFTKKLNLMVLAVCLLYTIPNGAHATEPIIIVNKDSSLSSISKSEIKNIFLGKKVLWASDKRIFPGLLNTDNPAILSFLKEYCGKSPRRFNAHWMKRVFSGSGNPPENLSSTSHAIQFVASTPGAIAIVDSNDNSGRVKRLKIRK